MIVAFLSSWRFSRVAIFFSWIFSKLRMEEYDATLSHCSDRLISAVINGHCDFSWRGIYIRPAEYVISSAQDGEYKLWYINIEEGIFDIEANFSMSPSQWNRHRYCVPIVLENISNILSEIS